MNKGKQPAIASSGSCWGRSSVKRIARPPAINSIDAASKRKTITGRQNLSNILVEPDSPRKDYKGKGKEVEVGWRGDAASSSSSRSGTRETAQAGSSRTPPQGISGPSSVHDGGESRLVPRATAEVMASGPVFDLQKGVKFTRHSYLGGSYPDTASSSKPQQPTPVPAATWKRPLKRSILKWRSGSHRQPQQPSPPKAVTWDLPMQSAPESWPASHRQPRRRLPPSPPPPPTTAPRPMKTPASRQRGSNPLGLAALVAARNQEALVTRPLYARGAPCPTPWPWYNPLKHKLPDDARGPRDFASAEEWHSTLIRRQMSDTVEQGQDGQGPYPRTHIQALHEQQQAQHAAHVAHKKENNKHGLEAEETLHAEFIDKRIKRAARFRENPFVGSVMSPVNLEKLKKPREQQVVFTTELNGRRRKCDYCRHRPAINARRAYWHRANEMINLCSFCERRRRRGDILNIPETAIAPAAPPPPALTAEELAVIQATAKSQLLHHAWEVMRHLAQFRRRVVHHSRQLCTQLTRETAQHHHLYHNLLWEQNPVRRLVALPRTTKQLLMQKMTSMHIPAVLRKFVSSLPEAMAKLSLTPHHPVRRVSESPPIYRRPAGNRRSGGIRKQQGYIRNNPRLFFHYLS